MKKILFIVLLLLSVSSCKFIQAEIERLTFWTRVEEALDRENSAIPDSLFSFFPDKSDKYASLEIKYGASTSNASKPETPYIANSFITYSIIEMYQCDDKELLQLLTKEYYSQSIFSIKSEDTDYFIIESDYITVDSENEIYYEYYVQQLKEKYLAAEDKVILSFKNAFNNMPFLHDSTTISGLPAGYEILVLKSGNKFILPQNYCYNWTALPDNLKHGYRSGVAFKEDEPYIIYWAATW